MELNRKNRDHVKLKWGAYSDRDIHMVTISYHCQMLDHIPQKCAAKTKGEDPFCAKCAGSHIMRECMSIHKCKNSMRFEKTDLEHMANYAKCCKVLEEELQKLGVAQKAVIE